MTGRSKSIFADNAPGGFGKQWMCITATNWQPCADLEPIEDKVKGSPGRCWTAKEGYMTPGEASRSLGLCRNVVGNWVRRGHIPAIMDKGYWWVKIEDAKAYNANKGT